jgi:cold shock CspA family protein
MLLAWDFKFFDKNNTERETKTSLTLLDEATYPILMHQLIGDGATSKNPEINGLFAHKSEHVFHTVASANQEVSTSTSSFEEVSHHAKAHKGYIDSLKEGYGFIAPEDGGDNLFFFHAEILNADFNELQLDDPVRYHFGENNKGVCAVRIRITEEDAD